MAGATPEPLAGPASDTCAQSGPRQARPATSASNALRATPIIERFVSKESRFIPSALLHPPRLVQERLHRLEQYEPVLFHVHRMRSFRELDVTLAGRIREQGEQRLRHV